MPVKQDLENALKEAMKARDSVALDSIRAVIAEMKKQDVKKEWQDAEVHAIIQKAVKQRRDSIESFRSGGRDDLAKGEELQIAVLEKFLPAQMDEAQVTALVDEAMAATGAAGGKDMGKVMGWLMPKVKGKADGSLVNRVVKARLG
ncbi:MAG: GatB/YqeY domain-containing protein [candidate division FCPU426 bacterium]